MEAASTHRNSRGRPRVDAEDVHLGDYASLRRCGHARWMRTSACRMYRGFLRVRHDMRSWGRAWHQCSASSRWTRARSKHAGSRAASLQFSNHAAISRRSRGSGGDPRVMRLILGGKVGNRPLAAGFAGDLRDGRSGTPWHAVWIDGLHPERCALGERHDPS